jgi:lipoate-protein ligase B
MTKMICEVHRFGLIEYQAAWDLQNRFATEIAAGERPPTLLLLEHPHTYTFGRRGEAANLLWDEAELDRRGVTVHWVDRGGDVTYHGPGQLVGYPLLPLGSTALQKVDYIGYIRKLERVLIAAVAEFGVTAAQVEGLTGVWVTQDWLQKHSSQTVNSKSPIYKLAAIGVKVDARGVSHHGFALNVDPDMAYWEGIVGCGFTYPEISLAQLLDPALTMDQVIGVVLKAFQQEFGYEIQIAYPNQKNT